MPELPSVRERARGELRELLALRPAPGAWWTAGRAAIATLIVFAALAGLDLFSYAMYASFGLFAAVYSGTRHQPVRWRSQTLHAALLVIAVTLGVCAAISDARTVIAIPLAAACAAAAAHLSDRQHWAPPGPMFIVFAVTSCASIPRTWPEAGLAVLITGASATVAVAVGLLEQSIPRSPIHPDGRETPGPPPIQRTVHRMRVHAARCAAAVILAGVIAVTLDLDRPYWAMVAAVAPLAGNDSTDQIRRAVFRVLGTLIGVGVAAGLLALHPNTGAAILIATVLQLLINAVVRRNYGLALIFITPLALLLGELGSDAATSDLIASRLLETLIGASIAVVLVTFTRSRFSTPANPPA